MVRLLARAAVVWRLEWRWRIYFKDHSHGCLEGFNSSPDGCFLLGCPSILTAGQVAFPRASEGREREEGRGEERREKRVPLRGGLQSFQNIILEMTSHHFHSLGVSHRFWPTLKRRGIKLYLLRSMTGSVDIIFKTTLVTYHSWKFTFNLRDYLINIYLNCTLHEGRVLPAPFPPGPLFLFLPSQCPTYRWHWVNICLINEWPYLLFLVSPLLEKSLARKPWLMFSSISLQSRAHRRTPTAGLSISVWGRGTESEARAFYSSFILQTFMSTYHVLERGPGTEVAEINQMQNGSFYKLRHPRVNA